MRSLLARPPRDLGKLGKVKAAAEKRLKGAQAEGEDLYNQAEEDARTAEKALMMNLFGIGRNKVTLVFWGFTILLFSFFRDLEEPCEEM